MKFTIIVLFIGMPFFGIGMQQEIKLQRADSPESPVIAVLGQSSTKRTQDFQKKSEYAAKKLTVDLDVLTKELQAEPQWPARKKIIIDAIDAGVDPAVLNYNMQPLEEAVMHDDTELVDFLLKRGANPNNKGLASGDEKPFLFCATKPEIAQLLLKYGADVHAKSQEETVLFTAMNHVEAVKLIKLYSEFGIDAGTFNAFGATPLHQLVHTCDESSPAIVQAYVEAGVPLDVRPTGGKNKGLTFAEAINGEFKKVARSTEPAAAKQRICYRRMLEAVEAGQEARKNSIAVAIGNVLPSALKILVSSYAR